MVCYYASFEKMRIAVERSTPKQQMSSSIQTESKVLDSRHKFFFHFKKLSLKKKALCYRNQILVIAEMTMVKKEQIYLPSSIGY